MFRAVFHYCGALWSFFIDFFGVVVGDPGIEPGVRLREGVTVPCHTLRPVALRYVNISNEGLNRRSEHVRQHQKTTK